MEGMAVQYFLIVLITAVSCERCVDDLTTERSTTLFNQQTYKTQRPLSLYECAAECRVSRACSSIYFERDTETCNLNTNGSYNSYNVSRPDVMYSERKHFPKSVSGACFRSSCDPVSKCEVDRFGRTLCVPDAKDCGEPPELPGTNKLTDHHVQGGRTMYTCKPDFVACGATSMTSLCRPSGSWDQIDTLCGRFRWTIVGASTYYLPCGPSGGINITMYLTPTKPQRITIAIDGNLDMLFNLGFRLDARAHARLVINSRISKRWGKELKFPIPLTLGLESEIIISFYHGVYKLQVDGKHICTFLERKIGAKPDKIRVQGPVDVQMLEIRRMK